MQILGDKTCVLLVPVLNERTVVRPELSSLIQCWQAKSLLPFNQHAEYSGSFTLEANLSFVLCAVPQCAGLYNTQSLRKTSALVIFWLCVLPLKLLHLCYKRFAACALSVRTISTPWYNRCVNVWDFSVQMSQQAQNSQSSVVTGQVLFHAA